MTANIPNDPVMLLSYINTQLRDNYGSLTDLCHSTGADEKLITEKLNAIGCTYDAQSNQFR